MIRIPATSIICLGALVMIEPTPYLAIMLLSVLCHEAGHLLAMGIMGIEIERITLLPVGVDIQRRNTLIPYWQEVVLSLAGPCVNIMLFVIFGHHPYIASVNILYAIFNLLPVRGLDGGNALYSALCCHMTPDVAEGICRVVSLVCGALLWMAGIYVMLCLGGNISIFALAVFLFLSHRTKHHQPVVDN